MKRRQIVRITKYGDPLSTKVLKIEEGTCAACYAMHHLVKGKSAGDVVFLVIRAISTWKADPEELRRVERVVDGDALSAFGLHGLYTCETVTQAQADKEIRERGNT